MTGIVRLTSILAGLALLPFSATPAMGQDASVGQVASSSVGRQGERLIVPAPTTRPLSRVDSRITNRVQSRVRNRIDRFYAPQANATSPFVVAGEQAGAAGRAR